MNLTHSFADGALTASVKGHIGELLVSRTAKKNAFSLAMWNAIPEAMDWLAGGGNAQTGAQTGAYTGARVVLIRGDGGDFSAGADISEFAAVRKDTASAIAYEAANSAAFAALRTAPVPVVAVIRGICFGGALGLAAACDFRIADTTARFAVPAAKLGLAYPADAMADIVAALGQATARLALFSGRQFLAADLAACGFLTALAEPEKLEEIALSLAGDIANNAPLSVRASKTAIRAVLAQDAALMTLAQQQGAATFDSLDYREGRAAFAERRKPDFTGQ